MSSIDNIYLELFFKPSAEYYIRKFEKFDHDQKNSFNVAAFLFGTFWLLYRKMYKQALALFGLLFLCTTTLQIITNALQYSNDFAKAIQYALNLTFSIYIGFNGNRIYLNHAKKKIEVASITYVNDEMLKQKQIAKAGGTSTVAVILVLIVTVFFVYVSTLKI